jgi:hypothetical protein
MARLFISQGKETQKEEEEEKKKKGEQPDAHMRTVNNST